ncbi:response regulator [Streptomyces sp. NPDC057253]|uniref:response regulator n=1 Tax=Streptomyces sp. NPDC057253 TaxID=3346069 RepID=UPI00363ED528
MHSDADHRRDARDVGHSDADDRAVRVVIADDHPMYRYGLSAALATSGTVEVVAEAANGEELLAAVARTSPDVVVTDLAMPGLDGAAATRALAGLDPCPGVLVLTMHEDDEALFAALRAGARGYLLKDADRAEIVRAVLAVAEGQAVYGQAVARRIVDFFTGVHRDYAAQVFPELTEREREVLELIALGIGNHRIAARLVLSEKTVRNHVSAILTKLHVSDRAAAVARARDAGLGGRPRSDG